MKQHIHVFRNISSLNTAEQLNNIVRSMRQVDTCLCDNSSDCPTSHNHQVSAYTDVLFLTLLYISYKNKHIIIMNNFFKATFDNFSLKTCNRSDIYFCAFQDNINNLLKVCAPSACTVKKVCSQWQN